MVTPAKPLASGRDSDVYGYAEGLVLRRYRDGRSAADEATVIRQLGELGYPVPFVHSSSGPDIVMERVDGPTMAGALRAGSLGIVDGARQFARLHDDLHDIPWPGAAPGDCLLHLDLHPLNVLMAGSGAVVIDWSNARPGPAGLDVAMSALILAQVVVLPDTLEGPPELEELVRDVLTEFLTEFAGTVSTPYAGHLAEAEELRRQDPNMSAEELRLMSSAVDLARSAA
ncbi:phosphotransferase [Nocardioides sp.]|uniref:phosphotransferase n=1 Tax=Nocardioides sp. TaxID=35761 RepID=UPI0031FE50FA